MRRKINEYLDHINNESIFPMDSINKGENKPFRYSYTNEDTIGDENKNICIDLDGVIHSYKYGFQDGTLYGKPNPDAKEAIDLLKNKYNIIIFTTRMSPSYHSEKQMKKQKKKIKKWLDKYDIYYDHITSEKVPASFYIDDKAIKFQNWKSTLKTIKQIEKEREYN